jgi:hypothetical protein
MKYPESGMDLPEWWAEHRSELYASYASGQLNFLPFALPEQVLKIPMSDVLDLLRRRFGAYVLNKALQTEELLPGPHSLDTHSSWIRHTRMVGINIRTVGDFAGVLKYALTLPASQDSIHLLPFWEPGVLSSLYAMSSWNINPEFYSGEWAACCPDLNTPERQLKALVNLLHAMGKSVGLDVIPHVDRYAEIVLAQPAHFEWLQRKDAAIVNHRANLHEEVEALVWNWLQAEKPAGWVNEQPDSQDSFFKLPESTRLQLLFGPPSERVLRSSRRGKLIDVLVAKGYEPVPATMGPPYRGLEVDPETRSVDEQGRVWCEYRIKKPTPMSRVFGPLTRYKLYERLEDNSNWAIDFSQPRAQVWEYICEHFAQLQAAYGFDFMRGDMSHVQMRPEGVPAEADDFYDIHRAIKHRVIRQAPHFGYFAESFLAPPNTMAFGVEEDHLEMSSADATLGDLQSIATDTPEFLQQFRRYIDLSLTRTFVPSLTVMTGDKDDPRFDHFYRYGNEARLFLSLFITDMPGYMALGFECRDRHDAPTDNEFYSKLYVFRNTEGPQAVRSAYRWGQNGTLFFRLTRIRLLADLLLPKLSGQPTHWLLPPDATGGRKVLAWTQKNTPLRIFALSLEANLVVDQVQLSWPFSNPSRLRGVFSSHRSKPPADVLPSTSGRYTLCNLEPGECVAFEIDAL